MTYSRRMRDMLLSTAAVSLALSGAPGALAQEADDEAVVSQSSDVIVVRGIRGSIMSSIAAKRESDSIVEAISAEDIGQLPDTSIAEALARLPGLTAQRLRGRAQLLSVRGLGPSFTTALLNGREQVTTGDGRGVEFDQYPSELVNQVLVYKTPDAQLVAAGLAGTADIRTIRPLAFGRESLSLSASYEFNGEDQINPDVETNGYRLTGTYVNQFANDTIGVVLGFADQSTPTQSERYEICNFEDRGGSQSPDCFKMFSESRELERQAFLGTLEYEPNDTFNTSLDLLYTDYTDGGIRRGAEFPLGTWLGGGSGLQLLGAQTDDGLVTAGTFGPVFAVGRNDVQSTDATLFAIGWNAQWRPADRWVLEADVSHSSVERDSLDFESYFGFGEGSWGAYPANDRLDFAFTGDRYRFNSQVGAGYSDPNLLVLTDPGGWGQDGFNKTLSTDDELSALRASATREFDDDFFFSSIEGGIYYSQREKSRVTDEFFVDLASGNGADPFPAGSVFGTTDLSWVSNVSVVAYDPQALLASGFYTLRPLAIGNIPEKQWTVEENVLVAYAQGNVDTQLGSMPLRGNVGVQIVNTDQSATGPVGVIGQVAGSASGGDEYTEVLPSANFSLELTENTFLRTAYARTLARANMSDMRASQGGFGLNSQICGFNSGVAFYNDANYDPNDGQYCLNGSSGNPALRPYIADAFDIALERYFADGAGYVSVAAYHKEIESWVFGSVNRPVDVTDAAVAQFGQAFVGANPTIANGQISEAQNADGGWIQGLEFATSLPGEIFTDRLDGFGVFFSYSITDSEIEPSPGNVITIPGLSEDVGNITVYYERGGFEARISNRWRGDFLAELPDFTGQPQFRSAFEESVIDAQIGYEFTSGPFEGVSILFAAQNLNDERFGTFINNDPRQARNYEEYGTTYSFRLNYRR